MRTQKKTIDHDNAMGKKHRSAKITPKILSVLLCIAMLMCFFPQAILAEAGEALNGGEELAEYAFTEDGEEETPAYVVGEGDDRPAGDETVASKLAADPLFAAKDSAVLKYVDEKAFASGKHVKRLADEEALDTYVFLNKDNTKSVYYMFENVKYIDDASRSYSESTIESILLSHSHNYDDLLCDHCRELAADWAATH